MAGLTHVERWYDDKGWRPITIEEAVKLEHHKVSSREKRYRCSLCGKYVALAKGEHNASAFKHNRGDEDKECPERTQEDYRKYTKLQKVLNSNPILPYKLSLKDDQLQLMVGLLPLDPQTLEANKENHVKIYSNTGKLQRDISFKERLSADQVTYVTLSDINAVSFRFELDVPDEAISRIWGKEFIGVRDKAVFRYQSRRMVSQRGQICIGEKYYLLSKRAIKKIPLGIRHCLVHTPKEKDGFYLYTFDVSLFSRETSEELYRWGYSLTEKLTPVYPIWPVFTQFYNQYKFNTNACYLLYSSRDGSGESVDTEITSEVQKRVFKQDFCRVVVQSPNKQKFDELILRKKPTLEYWEDKVEIKVSDIKSGEAYQMGQCYNCLPEGRLHVTANFRISAYIYEKHFLINKKINQTEIILPTVELGQEIRFYHGSDLLGKISFIKRQDTKHAADDELFKRLISAKGRMINFPHDIASIGLKMRGYPLCFKWLKKCQITDSIPLKCVQLLKKEFGWR
ncbi:hypothetical protein lacNasYZ03_14490 [Lactobacillus nasalidis]|uniref:Competence protein CoiA n=1 Tax=Lactobacillus nasalidis TaxID=2797258 RepID=A0ABQ3WC15_9LACO|nr:hypothetical protein [Lactobacillus nasalidis]GHV97612.1 hypothetical protein lacNasYZ01_07940 [Lactobacillus nasalidis]GHV98823.1 hypothetical protein lacNasYZ02_02530 [Lactobacillus nasalidis]GHW01762.1 hypothetical protein lacNasYZ03_14490 [Lactobacillus nasalidis]